MPEIYSRSNKRTQPSVDNSPATVDSFHASRNDTPAQTITQETHNLVTDLPQLTAISGMYKLYQFISIVTIGCSIIMPFLFYCFAQEQMFSNFTPSLTDWAAALSMHVFVMVLAFVSTLRMIYMPEFYTKCKDDRCEPLKTEEGTKKRQYYEVIIRYLFVMLIIGATSLGYLHNIYSYAKQGLDETPGSNHDNIYINMDPLRTNGAVSYYENHVLRFLNNLSALFHWSIFFSSHLLVAVFTSSKLKGS